MNKKPYQKMNHLLILIMFFMITRHTNKFLVLLL